jgi:hypothetical protein
MYCCYCRREVTPPHRCFEVAHPLAPYSQEFYAPLSMKHDWYDPRRAEGGIEGSVRHKAWSGFMAGPAPVEDRTDNED